MKSSDIHIMEFHKRWLNHQSLKSKSKISCKFTCYERLHLITELHVLYHCHLRQIQIKFLIGCCFNMKPFSWHGDSCRKSSTVPISCHLYDGNLYIERTAALYWDGPTSLTKFGTLSIQCILALNSCSWLIAVVVCLRVIWWLRLNLWKTKH